MPSKSHLSLDREELYDLVWSKPVQQLAKGFGISDRALAKLCARKQVPVPPRAYWQKMLAGRAPERPPLMPFVEKTDRFEKKQRIQGRDSFSNKRPTTTFISEETQTEFKSTLFPRVDFNPQKTKKHIIQIEVTDWDWAFDLDLNYTEAGEADRSYPYSDFRLLDILGEIVSPKNFKRKFKETMITLLPNIQGGYPVCKGDRPQYLGLLDLDEGDCLVGHVDIPEDFVLEALQLLSLNKFKFMQLTCFKIKESQYGVMGLSIRSNPYKMW